MHYTPKQGESSFVAKVISKGRITIPNEIRQILEINNGDFVECNLTVVKHVSAKVEDELAE